MEKVFFTAEIILCTLSILMGVIFFIVPVPANEHLRNYRISLKVLAVDYIMLGLLELPMLIFWEGSLFFGYFNFIRTLVSSLQAFLFTFALLNLLNPQFITRRRLYSNITPLAVFVVLYSASLLIFGDFELYSLAQLGEGLSHPTMVIRLLFVTFYAVQLGYYCYLFYIEAKLLKRELEDYFSDTHMLNLEIYLNLLRGAILVGVIALISLIQANLVYEIFFTIVTIVFYFLFAVKFINYTKIFVLIEPAIVHAPINTLGEPEKELKNLIQKGFPEQGSYKWRSLRKTIVDQKLYLKEQVTLEDIAQTLRISRSTLSNLINSEEGQSFYGWISSLRVEHAKALIVENPSYSITQIAQLIGFTEASNFSRTFKSITGLTPTEWRKNNL